MHRRRRRFASAPPVADALHGSLAAPTPTTDSPDIELPLGSDRARRYRLWEILPAALSIGLSAVVAIIAVLDVDLAAWIILVLIAGAGLRGLRGVIDAIRGYLAYRGAGRTDWAALNAETEQAIAAARRGDRPRASRIAGPRWVRRHQRELLTDIAASPEAYPLPSSVVHAVLVTAYNEPYEVVRQSLDALAETTAPEGLVVILATEERGGAPMRAIAERLEREYGYLFRAFLCSEHPDGLAHEIAGKGANLAWAGQRLAEWVRTNGVDERSVVVTSLDCDNRPQPAYFDAVTYEFVRAADRSRVAFEPISLFTNNIWQAPAPMRVIAAGNSLWTLITTVRPFSLKNFASHSQPLAALRGMGWWSRRTIVEDGHQFWRSWFHFDGRYRVVPIRVPITQDAVLTETLPGTLRAQFTQLSRWAYGVGDVPYVAVRLFTRDRRVPFWRTLAQFLILLDSHLTLAVLSPLIILGPWLPIVVVRGLEWLRSLAPAPHGHGYLLVNVHHAVHIDTFADTLPGIIDSVERAAMPGLLLTIVLSYLLLPKRPPQYGWRRSVAMFAQWILVPFTALGYFSTAWLSAQLRIALGRYRERFDVTEKAVLAPDPERA